MRLIDADALWKDITTNIEYCAVILEIIEKQPTIETEQQESCDTCKHGYFGSEQCNNCRVGYPSHYEADMREEQP